jgi:UMF1 family MFS transporter
MAHPQHAIPLILTDGEVRPVVRAPMIERMSWALYDFSNTIFSMNVATLYFTVWLVSDLGVSNTMEAAASAVASALVVVSIPFLGAISDVRRRRKPWVVGFTILACIACAMIGVFGQRLLPLTGEAVIAPVSVPAGWHASGPALFWVLAAFVLANFAYQAAQPFYNAMMPELVPVEERGRLSGSTAVGYVGSVVAC